MSSFYLNKYPSVKLVSLMVSICLTLQETLYQFAKIVVPFYVPTNIIQEIVDPDPCQHLVLSPFLILAIRMNA